MKPSCLVILGNAYLSYMFNCSLKREDLSKALNAYEKAKFLPRSCNHPDLYYNQSTVHIFSHLLFPLKSPLPIEIFFHVKALQVPGEIPGGL